MGADRDLDDMIRELVWLQANVDALQEFSIIVINNKAIHNDDIRAVILGDSES